MQPPLPTIGFLINSSDPFLQGLLQSFYETGTGQPQTLIYPYSYPFTLSVVQETGDQAQPYEYLDLSGAAGISGIVLGVGLPNLQPTAGTWNLSWGGNTASALAWNISAAALQTAINTITNEAGDGNVVVTLAAPGCYRIVFSTVNVRSSTFTPDGSDLLPLGATAVPTQVEAGTAEEYCVWEIDLVQVAYAAATPTAPLKSFTLAGIAATTVNASPTVTLGAATGQSVIGWTVTGANIPGGTTILNQVGTALTLSNNASAGGATTLSFSGATINAVTVAAGTSALPAIQSITVDPVPYAGSAIWCFSRPEVTQIGCLADSVNTITSYTATWANGVATLALGSNATTDLAGYIVTSGTAGIPAGTVVTAGAVGTPGLTLSQAPTTTAAAAVAITLTGCTLNNTVAGVLYDPNGPVQIVLNNGLGTTGEPAAPAGGRNLVVTYPAITTYITGNTSSASTTVTVASTAGLAVGSTISGSGVPALATVASINPGVSVVISAAATATHAAEVLAFTNTVPTGANIAALIAAAVGGDSQFSGAGCTAASGTATLTAAAVGPLTAAYQVTTNLAANLVSSGFTVTEFQAGCAITASLPVQADAAAIAAALGDFWTVQGDDVGDLTFTATTNGPQPLITLQTARLQIPVGVQGTLCLNTDEMRQAFYAGGASLSNLILFCQITNPGGQPFPVLWVQTSVQRGFLAPGGPSASSTPGKQSGSQALGNPVNTVTVVFPTPMPNPNWILLGDYVLNSTDATPEILEPSTFLAKSATGFTRVLTGPTNTGNYVYYWAAAPF